MKKFADLNLNCVCCTDADLQLLPSTDYLKTRCIQDLMRDYADIADWAVQRYAEFGRDDWYCYAERLMDHLAENIERVISKRR